MKLKTVNAILGVILILLSSIIGILLYMFIIKPGNTVVPDFIGKNVEEVYTWCGNLDDSHSCEVSYEDADGFEKDVVFEQSIKGGNKFKESAVSFKVATGAEKEIVLPFIGPDTNKSDIEAWAMTFGVTNITYKEEYSDTVEKNHVIRLEPSANVRRDTPITAYISAGKEEKKEDKKEEPKEIEVKFGDYIGLTVEEFEAKAKKLGLKPNHNTSRDQYDPHVEFGNIVWHGSGTYVPDEVFNYGICINELVITAGKYVGRTETEFINIANMFSLIPTHLSNRDSFSTTVPEGSVVTHGSGIYVKNEAFNYGLSLGAAKVEGGYEGASEEVFLSYLSKFGLKANRKTAVSETVAKGRIISYNTGKYSSGDSVTYVVSSGPEEKINVPDYSGRSEASFLKFLSDNGLVAGVRSVQSSMTAEGNIISNDTGSKKKGSSVNYVVSSGPYIPTAKMDKFEYLSEMISSDDDFNEAAEKAELYLKEKGFTNYEIQSVFLSSVKPGQLLMITVDGDMHSVAKEYPTYAQIVVQISSWLMSPPHN